MNDREYLKITSLPLSFIIEKTGEDIVTPMGIGSAYSLCFCYESDGELLQNPELWFLVIDNREAEKNERSGVQIIPFTFINADLEIVEESIEFDSQVMGNVNTQMQAHHVLLANLWIGTFKKQGILDL